MEYPIFIHGQKAGTLSITKQGLYTLIRAHAPGLGEGIYRIYLCGKGESRYLGLLEPGAEGMYLERRLTKNELAKLPAVIEYASEECGLHNQKHGGENTEIYIEKDKSNLHNTYRAAWEGPPPAEQDGRLWQRRADGSLVTALRGETLLALPLELRRPVPGIRTELNDGEEYMVFRY